MGASKKDYQDRENTKAEAKEILERLLDWDANYILEQMQKMEDHITTALHEIHTMGEQEE